MALFKIGDRLRLRPATAVFAGQHIHAGAKGTVIETRETSVGPEMIRVDFPGLDYRAWYTASLFEALAPPAETPFR